MSKLWFLICGMRNMKCEIRRDFVNRVWVIFQIGDDVRGGFCDV